MDADDRKRFEEALERKNEESEAKARANQPHGHVGSDELNDQNLTGDDRVQDDASVRDKNTRHGHVTADKWNQ